MKRLFKNMLLSTSLITFLSGCNNDPRHYPMKIKTEVDININESMDLIFPGSTSYGTFAPWMEIAFPVLKDYSSEYLDIKQTDRNTFNVTPLKEGQGYAEFNFVVPKLSNKYPEHIDHTVELIFTIVS